MFEQKHFLRPFKCFQLISAKSINIFFTDVHYRINVLYSIVTASLFCSIYLFDSHLSYLEEFFFIPIFFSISESCLNFWFLSLSFSATLLCLFFPFHLFLSHTLCRSFFYTHIYPYPYTHTQTLTHLHSHTHTVIHTHFPFFIRKLHLYYSYYTLKFFSFSL